MTTPPREHDTSDVGPVNEAAAPEAAPGDLPEVDGPGDFDPNSAVELLWHRVARVEAIARAARDSLESLPPLRRSDPEDQRAVERLHVLVTVAAEFAEEALAEAERQLALHGEHTAHRRPGEGR
jgi:hypothetical protein